METIITKQEKGNLIKKAKEITERFGRYPFKRKLEYWSVSELKEFIKAFEMEK